MQKLSAIQIADQASKLGLADDAQLKIAWGSLNTNTATAEDFCQSASDSGVLTNYQTALLRMGARKGFFFDDYKVLGMVSADRFARVFYATHKDSEAPAALKILRKRLSADEEMVARFLAEGKLGMDLKHANIVQTHNVISQGNTHVLRMEFIDGLDLRKLLDQCERCEPIEALRVMVDIARGLNFASKKSISHRCVKLSNIFVTNGGVGKLADFCLADEVEYEKGDIQYHRTLEYRALEGLTEVERGDVRSDIYFCGCVLYQLLTGKPPLDQSSGHIQRLRPATFRKVIQLRYFDDSIPREVATVVDNSMRLDPTKRYQTPMELLDALESAMAGLSDLSVPVTLPEATPLPESKPVSKTAPAPTPKPVPKQEPESSSIFEKGTPQDGGSRINIRSILVVAANARVQAILRRNLRSHGYQVSVATSPDMAVDKLNKNPDMASCVIFSTKGIGNRILTAFNEIAEIPELKELPAVLMLAQVDQHLQKEAKISKHRIVVPSSLKQDELVDRVDKLLQLKNTTSDTELSTGKTVISSRKAKS